MDVIFTHRVIHRQAYMANIPTDNTVKIERGDEGFEMAVIKRKILGEPTAQVDTDFYRLRLGVVYRIWFVYYRQCSFKRKGGFSREST